MKFQKHRTILSGGSRIALGFALLASGSAALAQAAPSPAPAPTPAAGEAQTSQGEEIVVTAQFREQNLQNTPLAITAVSGDMLEARSQTDISQVANQAPSVTLKPQGAAFGPSLAAIIRGVGQYDFNPALEPGVGVYVDDVYYATLTGSIFDLLDLDRVEILRGPQGTLAGRNSIGGAVKLYSKRPTGSDTGFIAGSLRQPQSASICAAAPTSAWPTASTCACPAVAKKQDGYVKRLDFGCVNPPGSALNPKQRRAAPIPRSHAGQCRLRASPARARSITTPCAASCASGRATRSISTSSATTRTTTATMPAPCCSTFAERLRASPNFSNPALRQRSRYAQDRAVIAATFPTTPASSAGHTATSRASRRSPTAR